MALRRVFAPRWIKDFKAPEPLKRQLFELEQRWYDAIGKVSESVGDLLGLSGLDGVKVVTKGPGVIVARRSREVLTVTAGGGVTGSKRKDFLRFELTANATSYGIEAPGEDDTHRLLLINASSYTLTLANQSGSAAADRRYACPHGVDFDLRPGECIEAEYVEEDEKWRPLGVSKPFKVVRALADLPTLSGGAYTLSSDVWLFEANVNVGTNQLDVLQGATVMTMPGVTVTGSHASNATVRVRNTHNGLPFRCANSSTGYAWECFTVSPQAFTSWVAVTGNVACSSLVLRMRGCEFPRLVIPRSVDDVHVDDGTGSVVISATNGSGTVGWVEARGVWQGLSYAGPQIVVETSMSMRYRLGAYQCNSGTNKLLDIGANMNDGGLFPHVIALMSHSSASGGITAAVVPAGGLTAEANTLNATPFSGFTALTAGVIARGNRTTAGALLQETPNGHIVKNNAGTQQTQRHYLKAGDGLEATDDGTNTVLSVSETTVEATLTFADDTTYGFELSGVLSLSSLPMNCVAALRVACAWGVTEASGGEETDIDQDGVLWVYVHVTKNNGTLMAVQFTNDRDSGFPVPELHVVHEAPAGDGNDPATEVSVFVQASSNNIEVIVTVPGSGVHSGPTFSGTATLHTDCVHERTALP